ncbi:MobA/MobL family protein, partial [Endozoicomonas sp. SM1973]
WNGKKRSEAGLPNRKQDLDIIREAWEKHANQALERAGHQERIDHRSLKDQGIDREPTKHLGPKATAMERNGARSDRGEENREIKARNDNVLKLAETQSEIRGLQEEKRKQEQYENRFKIPEKWQDREKTILKNHAEMHEIKNNEKALQQKLDAAFRIIDTPVKTYEEHVRSDKQLREYEDRVTQYEEQLRHGQRQINDLESRGLWSQMKVRLAEKGYLTMGETAKAVEYREKNAQALERSETLRDKRRDELYTNPLEKQRINKLIARDTHRQTQAHFDGKSYSNKIWELKGHYQRVENHTQELIDLENKESDAYNREQIERLKNLGKQIKYAEKSQENTQEMLPRKRDNTPLNNMEAAQHLPEFKAYNREWHEKYQDKINEWKTFEKQRPELAERLLNGTTKTRYKLLEELKAAKAERYDTLQRHANDPKNARAIENIKRQYALEGPESHSKQRLEKLRQEYTRVAESPSRG